MHFKKSLLKRSWLLGLFVTSTLVLAACSTVRYSNFTRYGVGIPLDAKHLGTYLEFERNDAAIANTPAAVVVNNINNAAQDDKLYFLNSFLKLKNEQMPTGFGFDVQAKIDPQNSNAINFVLTANQADTGAKFTKTIHVAGFKPPMPVDQTIYKTLVDHILKFNSLSFLIPNYDHNQLSSGETKLMNDYVRFSNTIMSKYNEQVFAGQPVANLYYAGNFNVGGNKQTNLVERSLENEAKELKALEGAKELIFKKETQPTRNLETNQILDPGYSDAPKVRIVIQKLLFLAAAYQINTPNNRWYNNPSLKQTIRVVLDDFATNYYYPGQQQYVNWWFYEIGIPKDLMKVLVTLQNVFQVEDFIKWSAGLNYFVPNARYGGAAKTAILNYAPVLHKRLQTGANVIDNAKPIIMAAVLNHDQNKIEDSILAMFDNLFRDFTWDKDGFYYDGSYIQHDNLAYIGSYGEVLFTNMAEIFSYFENTPFSISNDLRFEKLYQFIELAVMPFMFAGGISAGLNGRSIVRVNYAAKQKGLNILGSLAIFEQSAPFKYKARLHNFIIDQLNSYSPSSFTTLATQLKIPLFLQNSLLPFINAAKMGQDGRLNEDWNYYETNYFNQYDEPYVLIDDHQQRRKVPVGIDLAEANNGLVFTKHQDRFSWKQPGFMLNVNAHGRKSGFNEALLGENEESYYQADGSTLLATINNSDPYSDEYWSVVDPNLIPGTSSYASDNYSKIYDYQYPQNLGSDQSKWSVQQVNEYNKFMNDLKAKNDQIEKTVSLSTNNSFTNGLIYQNMGYIKTSIINWNQTLTTRKAYFLINNQIIVVGNVSQKNNQVKTTIANRMFQGALDTADKQVISQTTMQVANRNLSFFHLSNTINHESIGYVILGKNQAHSQKLIASKYPIIANFNRNNLIEGKINRSFDWLGYNHKDDNTFIYSIIPNYDPNLLASYQTTLNNFQVLSNNANYIITSYTQPHNLGLQTNYFIGSYFFNNTNQKKALDGSNLYSNQSYLDLVKNGVEVKGLNTKFYFDQPTTMIISKYDHFSDWFGVASFDLNPNSAKVKFDQPFLSATSRIYNNPNFIAPAIKNTPEASLSYFNNESTLNFNANLTNDRRYNHNMWFVLKGY